MQDQTDVKLANSSGELAILEAAEILFAEKGFDATTMSAIARLANTSKPNIYHHFRNKDELYLAIVKTAVHRSSALLDALQGAPGSFRQRLADFSAGQLENVLSHQRSSQLILREALSGGSERGREVAKHFVGEVFTRLVEMVHKGQQGGEFRADIDPALAAFMVVATNVFFFQSIPVMKDFPMFEFTGDAGIYSEGVMDLLLNGLIDRGESAS